MGGHCGRPEGEDPQAGQDDTWYLFYGSPIKGGSCVKRWNEPRLGLEDRGLKLDFYYVRQKLGVGPSQFF